MCIFEQMKNNLHVSLVQSSIYWKDIDKNLSHFKTLVSDIEKTDLWIILTNLATLQAIPT